MPKPHRSKPHQIRLSDIGKPHELSANDWFALVESGVARIEADTKESRLAVLRLPFVGWVHNGVLLIGEIGASIKSTWLAWEREWLHDISSAEFRQRQFESALETALRVQRERETALMIEALEWQSTRRKTRKNSFRWVSREHLEEILAAFGRTPQAQ